MPPVMKTTLWLVLALASAAASASADERRQASDFGHSEAEIGPLRYSMALVEGGIALLDRQTGTLEHCSVQSGQFVCRLAVDERDGYEAEIARLRARLDAQEAGQPEKPEKPRSPEKSEPKVSEDQRLNEAMRHAGRALRRFLDAVRDLRSDG